MTNLPLLPLVEHEATLVVDTKQPGAEGCF